MWKNTLQCLSIHQIEIIAPVGVYDFEKTNQNKFLISVDIWGDFTTSMKSDNLSDTLDYQLIYEIAQEVMQQGGDLIEAKCKAIADKIIQIDFPMTKIRVLIEKIEPPLKSKVSDTRFELVWEKL